MRAKTKQQQMLYQNLQRNIDNLIIRPPEEQSLLDSKIQDLKQNFDSLYLDNYQLKVQFDVLMNHQNEKEEGFKSQIEALNKKLLLEQNKQIQNLQQKEDLEKKLTEQKEKNRAIQEENIEALKQINLLKDTLLQLQEQKASSQPNE